MTAPLGNWTAYQDSPVHQTLEGSLVLTLYTYNVGGIVFENTAISAIETLRLNALWKLITKTITESLQA